MIASSAVWILFADALAAPEVAWSLHDAGLRVVAVRKAGSRAAVSVSRHVEVVEVTDPALSVGRSLSDLKSLLLGSTGVIVMPLDDLAIWMVGRLATELQLEICGPSGLRAEVALDKRLQFLAARNAGFEVPSTTAIVSRDDLSAIPAYPCIVKPALAARVVGDHLGRGRASFFQDEGSARRAAVSWGEHEPMLAQPYLEGVGEGLFGLALDDGIVLWSAHRRIRMMNPGGSGSSACTNADPDPETCAIAERFVDLLDWRGLFMIEFLRDRDGRLWFMELNGRPWGSMALSRRTGYEYPAWAIRAMQAPPFIEPAPARHHPLVCRHIGRELIHLMFVLRGPRADEPQRQWPRLLPTLRDLLTIGPRQALYNWRRDDPLVLVVDALYSLRASLFRKRETNTSRPSLMRRIGVRFEALREKRRQVELQRTGLPAAVVREASNILFICYGNINRSALAERYLDQLTGGGLTINSCGFHRDAARPADPQMVAVASSKGVHLEQWSSRRLSTELVDRADVILAMESSHLVRLNREHPSTRGRAFLLGSLLPLDDGPLEIADPFGGTRSQYERCFDEVTRATTALAKLMPPSCRSLIEPGVW